MSLALDYSYEEALDYIESTLANLLPAGEDPAPIRKAFDYQVVSYGGEFPVICVQQRDANREPRLSDRTTNPGQVTIDVSILYPSLKTPSDQNGRKTAKRVTRHVASLFREALYATNNFGGQVHELYISSESMGDVDEMGSSRIDAASGSILWEHRLEVVVVF
ncbi:hypothetical protein [Rubrobacter calidifluminis]|uniref:hypothetical protein n=1 Tax=Rubrobacter calidifluminis TaxID=1392640 RepID=UPI00236293EE|nr:hypothetical protein [Rubrobacter calidifluminis]